MIVRLVKIRVIGVWPVTATETGRSWLLRVTNTIHSSVSAVELGVVVGLDEAAGRRGWWLTPRWRRARRQRRSAPPRATMLLLPTAVPKKRHR